MTRFVLSAVACLALSACACLALSSAAAAHSASDAYLNLSVDAADAAGHVTIHGQWDIALRDLDFVLKLDDDGDGRLTWKEVRGHQSAIAGYAYRHLTLDGGTGTECTIKPGRQMIDGHADGAYAALSFTAVCTGAPRRVSLHYALFFAIDPSHRGILVMRSGNNVATALLSPDNAKIDLGI